VRSSAGGWRMGIRCGTGSELMAAVDALLTITRESVAGSTAPTLVVRCPHGTTTLDLPTSLAAAVRSLTAVAILQHYSTTGCSCTRSA
jgi:hypothetical protein